MNNVIGIFTGKDLKWMESEGGSGYWIAKTDRIKNAKYVIFVRNHRETWAVKDDGLQHGQAFMIGRISGCVPTPKYLGRKLIQISEYSLLPDTLNFKQAWKKLTGGQRYPVAYLNTDDLSSELDLDVDNLEWTVFDPSPSTENDGAVPENVNASDDAKELSEIIAEAKEMIAHAAGVDADKVNIQINF